MTDDGLLTLKHKETSLILAYWIRISSIYTVASKSYRAHPYPSRRKIKTENFHVFDKHWLCKLRYAIVTFDVTERNDINKRHTVLSS